MGGGIVCQGVGSARCKHIAVTAVQRVAFTLSSGQCVIIFPLERNVEIKTTSLMSSSGSRACVVLEGMLRHHLHHGIVRSRGGK